MLAFLAFDWVVHRLRRQILDWCNTMPISFQPQALYRLLDYAVMLASNQEIMRLTDDPCSC